MLSNIVFIIILILLVIILILLYFFSNDIRKNKNKINICESEINSLRERLSNLNQKVTSIENSSNNEFSSFKKNKNPSFDGSSMIGGQNFVDILEKLGGMNNNFMEEDDSDVYMNEDDDAEDDDEDEEDEEDEEDDAEDDAEEDDAEDDAEDDEEDDVDEDVEDDVEDDAEDDEEAEAEEEVEAIVEEVVPETEAVKEIIVPAEDESIKRINVETKEIKGLDDLLNENNNTKKLPKKALTKLNVGSIELSSDNKTKYIVQLNKAGRKYWKKI